MAFWGSLHSLVPLTPNSASVASNAIKVIAALVSQEKVTRDPMSSLRSSDLFRFVSLANDISG